MNVDIVIPDGLTREQLLAALDREIRYREVVFPRRVDAGKMSLVDARAEILKMKAVRAVIAQLPPTQPTLGFDAKARAAGDGK